MNEVYNDVLGKALSIKSTNNIVVKVEQGALEVNLKQCSVKRIMWFSVFLIDGFTMRPYILRNIFERWVVLSLFMWEEPSHH